MILRESDGNHLLQALAVMQKSEVVDLTGTLALCAAKISLTHQLPMADSVVLATAKAFNATLWTQDLDFNGIPGVKYISHE